VIWLALLVSEATAYAILTIGTTHREVGVIQAKGKFVSSSRRAWRSLCETKQDKVLSIHAR
jgi:hypothetical protein